MSTMIDFGFDDGEIVKATSVDVFKQTKPGAKSRISIISFKTFHEVALGRKIRERGADLSLDEKQELNKKIDEKIAEQLGKDVSELTEVDRLDLKSPKFGFSFVHYKDGIGTIKCLSKYEGTTLVEPDICCQHIGDPIQKIGTVIVEYPVNDNLQVEGDIFNAKKMTKFYVWVMSAKKFKGLESAYADARADGRNVIDLKVQLDGDPRYQKQLITQAGTAFFARESTPSDVKNWILEQGLRLYKYVSRNLGYEMSREDLMDKLGMISNDDGDAEEPKLITSYDDIIK